MLTLLGTGPRRSWVEVDENRIVVRMGWAFRTTVPRSHVTAVVPEDMKGWVGIGVHGFRGRWQVNGALGRGAAVEIEPSVRARVCLVTVQLQRLRIGVADPDAFVAAAATAS